jgi:hypothetical protein
MINSIILIYKYYLRYNYVGKLEYMGRGVFQFKSFLDTVHVQMMYPLPNPRISHTDARLCMNMVQIRLKSQDSRIPGYQLDLKIVMNPNSDLKNNGMQSNSE